MRYFLCNVFSGPPYIIHEKRVMFVFRLFRRYIVMHLNEENYNIMYFSYINL